MPQTDTYLFFNGNCAEAMRFYERTLGGKLEIMTGADAPPAAQIAPGDKHLVLHARLAFDDGRSLMASDWMGGQPYEGMKSFAVALGYTKVDEARRIFDALAEGGHVSMPFSKTFWTEGFGMVADRFGTPWMVSGQSA
jgi:PhnB protein